MTKLAKLMPQGYLASCQGQGLAPREQQGYWLSVFCNVSWGHVKRKKHFCRQVGLGDTRLKKI